MRVLVGPALAAFMLVQLCGADMPHTIHRAHSMEGFLAQQHQQGAVSQVWILSASCSTVLVPCWGCDLTLLPQGSGLAYVEPMALVNGGRLARGQSAAPAASRRCARPIGEVHVSGRPAPSLSSLQHMANTRWAVRQDVSLRRAGQVTMQADASFDPLGLASGMSAGMSSSLSLRASGSC